MSLPGAVGGWGKDAESINMPIDDLVRPTTESARTIGAVAKGDLGQSMDLEVGGRPLKGEFLRSAKLVNTMIQQLSVFTPKVTRVAREVGTEGKLGVSGVRKAITDSVNQMVGNLTDLLAFTEVTSFDPNNSAIDANQVFDQVFINLEQAALDSGAQITRDGLPSVSVHNIYLQQFFQNLVGNALKYRRDGLVPRVHVSAHRQTEDWQFSIQDNGIGVASEHRERIFGVFKRLHSNGAKFVGNGIGLAICRRIVRHYGGRIWLESEVGQGTTFHFTCPCEASFHLS